jgi:hypothetical protein
MTVANGSTESELRYSLSVTKRCLMARAAASHISSVITSVTKSRKKGRPDDSRSTHTAPKKCGQSGGGLPRQQVDEKGGVGIRAL